MKQGELITHMSIIMPFHSWHILHGADRGKRCAASAASHTDITIYQALSHRVPSGVRCLMTVSGFSYVVNPLATSRQVA